jgi:glutamate formiminotransferase/formiminotetrahydrofolate cyclodeaminase
MVKIGNPNSLSDAGVGAACLLTAMQGAWMNVLINAQGLDDKPWAENITAKARLLIEEGRRECNRMVEEVETRLQA